MTRPLAFGAYLCTVSACFVDPADLDDAGDDSSAGDESSAGSSIGTDGSPTTAVDGSGSASEGPAGACGDGIVEGDEICDDANAQDGDGCESDCQPSSGAPHWTVIEDGELSVGAYAVAVTGDGEVIAAGSVDVGNNLSDPWIAAYDGAGTQLWSATSAAGDGADYYRAVMLTDDGGVVASGSIRGADQVYVAQLDAYSLGGAAGWQGYFDLGFESRFAAATLDGAGGILAVGAAVEGTDPRPLVARYSAGGGGWEPNGSSEDSFEYGDTVGELLAVARTDLGRYIVAGYTVPVAGQGSQAAVWSLDENGYQLGQPGIFGGEGNDDVVDIVIEDGVVHALGRRGAGAGVSSVWLARLTVDDSVQVVWEATWSDEAFTVGNGLAVKDGVRFIAASTNVGMMGEGFDTRVLRWDGDNAEPTWVVPYAPDSPGLDYAGDIAMAPDGTVVVAGVVTPPDASASAAWIRKLQP